MPSQRKPRVSSRKSVLGSMQTVLGPLRVAFASMWLFLCVRPGGPSYFLKTIVSIMEPMARGTNVIEAPKMTMPTRIFRGTATTMVLICGCMREMNPTVISITKLATKTGKAIFQPMMKICFEA